MLTAYPFPAGDARGERVAQVTRRVAERHGLSFVELRAAVAGVGGSFFMPDGAHPTREGHAALADLLVPVVEPLLGPCRRAAGGAPASS